MSTEDKKWPVPIEVDWERRIVTAGSFTKDRLFYFPKNRQQCLGWVHCILPQATLPRVTKEGFKDQYKWVADNIGTGFWSAWNKVMYKLWIAGVRSDVSRLCVGFRARYDTELLNRYHNMKQIISVAKNDGNWHLTPLMLAYGKDAAGLKEMFGKGMWKQLCRNSFSRNKLLARPMVDKEALHFLNEVPSSLLKYGKTLASLEHEETFYITSLIDFLKRKSRLTATKPFDINRYVHTCRDTKRMAQQIGEPFNGQWSVSTMQERHEQYSKVILARKHSRDKYMMDRRWVDKHEDGEYSATLLTSDFSLAEEGNSMKHCVASYARQVQQGQCAIYSVRRGDERVSTLQLYPTDDGDTRVGQHYGPCNQMIPKEHKDGVEKLVHGLREKVRMVNEPLSFKEAVS